MNKPLDLPDVTLHRERISTELVITHKRTGMTSLITQERLNAWLLRQLRNELTTTKGNP